MTNEIKVVDNFLPKEDYEHLQKVVTGSMFPWYFQNNCTFEDSEYDPDFYFTHIVYEKNVPISAFFDTINEKLIEPKLRNCNLIRIKLNCYTRSQELIKNEKHVDFNFPHKNLIYAFNTCNGFTEFSDGQKVKSVANRAIMFGENMLHNSTNCTDEKARFNVNINYI